MNITCCPWVLHELCFSALNAILRLTSPLSILTICLIDNRQTVFDKRLQRIESKLDSLSQGIAGPQDDDEMSCQETSNAMEPPRPAGLLPKFDTGGITSAVALAISEEKERDKRKLNVIIHNLTESTSDDGNC